MKGSLTRQLNSLEGAQQSWGGGHMQQGSNKSLIYQIAISKSWVIRQLCQWCWEAKLPRGTCTASWAQGEHQGKSPDPKAQGIALLCLAMLGFAWMRITVLIHFQLCQLRMLTPDAHLYVIHSNSAWCIAPVFSAKKGIHPGQLRPHLSASQFNSRMQ